MACRAASGLSGAQDALGAFQRGLQVLLLRVVPGGEALIADGGQGVVDFVQRDAGGDGEVGELLHANAGAAHGVVGGEHGLLEFEVGEAADEAAHGFAVLFEEGVDGGAHGFLLHAPGFGGIEHAELGVDAGEDGVFAQQAGAEAVHGGDPGALQFGACFGLLLEGLRQLLAHVAGGLLGEGDGQDAQGIDSGGHQLAEVFHQHGGLAGAGSGDDAGIEVALGDIDGVELIGGEGDGSSCALH